jgi:hypothetical protein
MLTSPIQNTWANFALSRDGKVMAANYGGEIYRWTPNGGFVDLGPGDPKAAQSLFRMTVRPSFHPSWAPITPELLDYGSRQRAGLIWAILRTDASWTTNGAAGMA